MADGFGWFGGVRRFYNRFSYLIYVSEGTFYWFIFYFLLTEFRLRVDQIGSILIRVAE